jgi:hypothetical protein
MTYRPMTMDKITCTVKEALAALSLGRSKFYELVKAGAKDAEIEQLRAALDRIGKMSAPGSRTLDDFIRDMTWINDETRRVK